MAQLLRSAADILSHEKGKDLLMNLVCQLTGLAQQLKRYRMDASVHMVYIHGNPLPLALVYSRFRGILHKLHRTAALLHAELAHAAGGAYLHLALAGGHGAKGTDRNQRSNIFNLFLMNYQFAHTFISH